MALELRRSSQGVASRHGYTRPGSKTRLVSSDGGRVAARALEEAPTW
jgi:hypothetical protein